MGSSWQQIQQIHDDFQKEPLITSLYGNRNGINSSGVTLLNRILDSSLQLYKPLAKPFNAKDLRKEETLEDFCLIVGFEKTPSQDILSKLPDVYKGVRVFYEEIGENNLT